MSQQPNPSRLSRAFLAFALALSVAACQQPASPTPAPARAARYVYLPNATQAPAAAQAAPAPEPTPTPSPTPAPAATPAPSIPNAPATPVPTPSDVDTQACPVPSMVRIKVHLPNGHNGWVLDSVALTCNRQYCAGYKTPDGQSRECCPLGPEGSDQRVRCEAEMVPDGPSWQVRGGSHREHPTNPWLHFVTPPATVRACIPQGCSDWLNVSGS